MRKKFNKPYDNEIIGEQKILFIDNKQYYFFPYLFGFSSFTYFSIELDRCGFGFIGSLRPNEISFQWLLSIQIKMKRTICIKSDVSTTILSSYSGKI